MKLRSNFCVFILSYGRAKNIKTLQSLKKYSYTGDWFIVDSDDDKQLDEYRKIYGGKLCIFNKQEEAKGFDLMDNRKEASASIVYARNYCFELAKKLGYRYFLELDDDYTEFSLKFVRNNVLTQKQVPNIDAVFEATLQLLDDTGALTVAWSQGGDLIAGINGNYKKKILRKAMNTFFIDTQKPFKFIGRINEDVNMYCDLGSKGAKIFQVTDVMMNQAGTQTNANGMTSLYLDYGTYLKSFYSVMIQPSFVKLSKMGEVNYRIHHSVSWNNAVPKIINQKYKKA